MILTNQVTSTHRLKYEVCIRFRQKLISIGKHVYHNRDPKLRLQHVIPSVFVLISSKIWLASVAPVCTWHGTSSVLVDHHLPSCPERVVQTYQGRAARHASVFITLCHQLLSSSSTRARISTINSRSHSYRYSHIIHQLLNPSLSTLQLPSQTSQHHQSCVSQASPSS